MDIGVGGGEILIILIVALLIFGPNRIVQIGRTLGKTVHAFKKATSDITSKMEKELEEQESKKKENETPTGKAPQ
jgi:sec-independent protein translocase protein TatA